MNFLKILNTGLAGGGDGASSADGRDGMGGGGGGGGSRRSKRAYTAAEQESMAQVSFQLARVGTLALVDDQRACMEEVLERVRAQPHLPVDGEALRTLVQLARSIQADRQAPANTDLSLAALEILKLLLSPHNQQQGSSGDGAAGGSGGGGDESDRAATSNAQLVSLFVQQPTFVTTLLELLGEKHSVLRLYTMQCLTLLLMARTEKVQSLVLAYPMGVILLVELLSDRSEVIRNETLLLLEALTRGNQAIQKIVAFNGAMDKLFTIAHDEGRQDGGIIAEDAMRLIASLLQDNTSNQSLFLDTGCVARCIPYLAFSDADLSEDADGSFEFLLLALNILNHVTTSIDMNPAAPAHKNLSARNALSPLVQPLVRLAASNPRVPLTVRHECWSMLAIIVESHHKNQSLLDEMRFELEVLDDEQMRAVQHQQQQQQQAQTQQQTQYPQYAYDPTHNPYVTAAAAPAVPAVPIYRRVRRNALRHVLELSCDSPDPLERELLLFLLRAYFKSNPRGQLQSMMSFAPSPAMMMAAAQPALLQQGGGGMDSFGSDAQSQAEAAIPEEDVDGPTLGPHLLGMLSGSRPPPPATLATVEVDAASYTDRCRALAARVMEAMLLDNPDSQVLMLRVQPASSAAAAADAAAAQGAAKLLDHSVSALFSSQNRLRVELSLLSMLCTWCDGCVELNEAVFGKYASSLLAYLVQMGRDPQVHPTVRGLATYYIALALELLSNPVAPQAGEGGKANGAAPTAFASAVLTPAVLLDIITKQLTLDGFKSNLAALHSSPQFQQAQQLKDNKAANPLVLFRRLEAEYMGARGVGSTPNSASQDQTQQAELSDAEEMAKDSAVFASMDEALSLSHAFTLRFQAVYDKCDQRLLSLFTTAASAPVHALAGAAQAASHAGAQANANGTDSSHRLPPTQGASNAAAAASAVEQQLREENARLRHELQQAQAEIKALRAAPHSSHGGVSSTAAAAAAGHPGDHANVVAELARVRSEYDELLLEHEDLLILLATQEQELASVAPPAAKQGTAAPTGPIAASAATAQPALNGVRNASASSSPSAQTGATSARTAISTATGTGQATNAPSVPAVSSQTHSVSPPQSSPQHAQHLSPHRNAQPPQAQQASYSPVSHAAAAAAAPAPSPVAVTSPQHQTQQQSHPAQQQQYSQQYQHPAQPLQPSPTMHTSNQQPQSQQSGSWPTGIRNASSSHHEGTAHTATELDLR